MLFTPNLFTINRAHQREAFTSRKTFGQSVYVVPRSECFFRRTSVQGSGKKAIQALRLKSSQQAASEKTSFKFVRDNTGPGVGVWEYQELDDYKGRAIPESLLFPSLSEGARLIQTLNGYEGQIWNKGVLIASRWWEEIPPAQSWYEFIYNTQTETGISTDAEMPPVSKLPHSAKIPRWEMSLKSVLSPRNLTTLICLVCLGVLSFEGTRYVHNNILEGKINEEISQKSETASQALRARRRALSNIQFVEKHKELGGQGSLLVALSGLGEVLSGRSLIVKNLSYNSGEIEIILQSSTENSIPEMVNRLESIPEIENVNISIDSRNDMKIVAFIVSHLELDVD